MKTIRLIEKLFKSKKIKEVCNILKSQADIDLFFNYYLSHNKTNFDIVLLILQSGVDLLKQSEHIQEYSNYRLLFEYSIEQREFHKVKKYLLPNHIDNFTILSKICLSFSPNDRQALSYIKVLYKKTQLFTIESKECLKLIVAEGYLNVVKWLFDNAFKEDINIIKQKDRICYFYNHHLVSSLVDCIENKDNKVFIKKMKYLESIGLKIDSHDSDLLNAVGYLDDLITYQYLENKQVRFTDETEKQRVITDLVMHNSYKIIQYLIQTSQIDLSSFNEFDYVQFNDGIKTKYSLDYLAHACIFQHKQDNSIFQLLVKNDYNWKIQEKAILSYISQFSLVHVGELLHYLFNLNIYSSDIDSICTYTDCGQAILEYLEIKNIEKEKAFLSTYLKNDSIKTMKI